MKEKSLDIRKLLLLIAVGLFISWGFTSFFYTRDFNAGLFNVGYSAEYLLDEVVSTPANATYDPASHSVSFSQYGVLRITQRTKGKDNRYLHIKASDVSVPNQMIHLKGYDKDDNMVYEKVFELSNGTMVMRLWHENMEYMDLEYQGQQDETFTLDSVTLYKRYDGLQGYVFKLIGYFLIYVSLCIMIAMFMERKRIVLVDVLSEAFSGHIKFPTGNLWASLCIAISICLMTKNFGEARVWMVLQIALLILAGLLAERGDDKRFSVNRNTFAMWLIYVLFVFVSGCMNLKAVPFVGAYVLAVLFLATRLPDLRVLCYGVLASAPVVLIYDFIFGRYTPDTAFSGVFASTEESAIYGMALAISAVILVGCHIKGNSGAVWYVLDAAAFVIGCAFVRLAWENSRLIVIAVAAVIQLVLIVKAFVAIPTKNKIVDFTCGIVGAAVGVVVFYILKQPQVYLGLDSTLRVVTIFADKNSILLNAWDYVNMFGNSEVPLFYRGYLQSLGDKGIICTFFFVVAAVMSVINLIKAKRWEYLIISAVFIAASFGWNVEMTAGNVLWLMAYIALMGGNFKYEQD